MVLKTIYETMKHNTFAARVMCIPIHNITYCNYDCEIYPYTSEISCHKHTQVVTFN